jgi:hypothetical protein
VSTLDRIWSAFRAVLALEGDVRRLTERLAEVDARERETRERLIYLEGLIAGARTRQASPTPPLPAPD